MKLRLKFPAELPDLVLTIGAVSLILVCLFLLAVPAVNHLEGRARAAAVRGNAATIQLAAETYAAGNLGQYPEKAQDLVPYLPGRVLPGNPYTGDKMTFKGGPGDLTYRSPSRGNDYIIEAWGPGENTRSRLLLTLSGSRPAKGR